MKRTILPKRLRPITLFILFALSGVPMAFAQNAMVGVWEEETHSVHAIILRKPDGTYRRKVIQLYDYAQPPIAYTEDGHWRVNGKQYSFTADHISASRFKQDIRKVRTVKIIKSDAMVFKYFSTDGAVVEQRRIADESDAAFDRIRLGDKLINQKVESRWKREWGIPLILAAARMPTAVVNEARRVSPRRLSAVTASLFNHAAAALRQRASLAERLHTAVAHSAPDSVVYSTAAALLRTLDQANFALIHIGRVAWPWGSNHSAERTASGRVFTFFVVIST
jgi:hypothetical protein